MSSDSFFPPPTVRIQRSTSTNSQAPEGDVRRSKSQGSNERRTGSSRHLIGRPGRKSHGHGDQGHDSISRHPSQRRSSGLFESSNDPELSNLDMNRFLRWSSNSSMDDTFRAESPASTSKDAISRESDLFDHSALRASISTPARIASMPWEMHSDDEHRHDLEAPAHPSDSGRNIPMILVNHADEESGPVPPETPSENDKNKGTEASRSTPLLGNFMPKFSSLWLLGGDSGDRDEQGRDQTNSEAQDTHTQSSTKNGDVALHSDELVDYLDVLDPAVGLFNTLQDYGNSAMLPNLPWLYSRRPTLRLNQVFSPEARDEIQSPESPISPESRRGSDAVNSMDSMSPTCKPVSDGNICTIPMPEMLPATFYSGEEERPTSENSSGNSIDESFKEDEHLAEYRNTDDPHTERYWQMDKEERLELEAHVRYLLTRKSKTKRMLRGFWNFVRTPMGFILTTYISLIASWGIVIFLLIVNWVHVEPYHRRRVWIEVCDQVLCALFVLRGVGFMPFRVVDTYRMAHIAHFHFLTYKRRKLLNLPRLKNENELPRYTRERLENATKHDDENPAPSPVEADMELLDPSRDLEAIGVKNAHHVRTKPYHFEQLLQPLPGQPNTVELSIEEIEKARLTRAPSIQSMVDKETHEVSVLTPSEQAQLQHHQHSFHSSHTFYRYRETATHRPFPLWLMMTIVILLDIYSMLQACLAGTTWGIRYERRPTVLTATIISCSLSCNAIAGILIWQGGNRTRKTEVVKNRVKLAIEEQAIQRMERKRKKQEEPSKRHTLPFVKRSSKD